MQIGPWRATYTPGQWVLLAGPSAMAVLQPAGPQHSALVARLWEGILAEADIQGIAGMLSANGLDQMPSLAVVFWDDRGMRSLVRGSVRLTDPESGRTLADGDGVVTWSENGLGDVRQIVIEVDDAPVGESLQLPLVVGGAQVSKVVLDARPVSSVQEPGGDLGAGAAAAAVPAAAAFSAPIETGDRHDGSGQAEERDEAGQGEDRLDPTEPLEAEYLPEPIGDETPLSHEDDLQDGQDEDVQAPQEQQAGEQVPEAAEEQHAEPVQDVAGEQPVADEQDHEAAADEQHVEAEVADSEGMPVVVTDSAVDQQGVDEHGVDQQGVDQSGADQPGVDQPGQPSTEDYESMDFEESARPVPVGDEPPAERGGPGIAPAVQPATESDTEVMPAVPGEGANELRIPNFTPPAAPQNPYSAPQPVPGTEPHGLISATPGGQQQVPNQGPVEPPASSPPDTQDADHDGATILAPGFGTGGPQQQPQPPQPRRPVAVLRPSEGGPLPVDRAVIIGRSPKPQPGTDDPALLTLKSPSHDISRTHLLVNPTQSGLTATDMHSTNGTILVRNGGGGLRRERLTPGEAVPVQIGDILDLGDGVTIVIDPPA